MAFDFNPAADHMKLKFKELTGDTPFTDAFRHQVGGYKDITITSAQMLTLNTAPVTLLPAPPAGAVILVDQVYATMVFNSAAYSTNASGANILYTGAAGAATGIVLTQAFLQTSSGTGSIFVRGSSTAVVPAVAAPIVLQAATSDPTTGDSVLNLRIYYWVAISPLVSVTY